MATKRTGQSRKSATAKRPARKARISKPARASAAAVVRKAIRAPGKTATHAKSTKAPVKKKPELKPVPQPQPKAAPPLPEESRIATPATTKPVEIANEIKAELPLKPATDGQEAPAAREESDSPLLDLSDVAVR